MNHCGEFERTWTALLAIASAKLTTQNRNWPMQSVFLSDISLKSYTGFCEEIFEDFTKDMNPKMFSENC